MENKDDYIQQLIHVGLPEAQANTVMSVLSCADLYGVTTHGVKTLDQHINRIKQGGYNLSPTFSSIRSMDSFTVIDCDNALGFVSAEYCMNIAIENAKKIGIYTVFGCHSNTIGPAFYYPLMAAKRGHIGIVFSNSPAQMPPAGGKEKILGTNPFSAVIPVPNSDPIIIDMASSVVAKSKFKEYKERGEKLPDGWALTKEGFPTNDPDEAIQGLILPMAGYKGYAISMLIDIIAGVLSGSSYLNKVGRFYSSNGEGMDVGFCCCVINPYLILGDEYDLKINDFVRIIRESEPINDQTITIPGDRKIASKNGLII